MVDGLTKLFESHSTISVALMFGSCAIGTQTFDSDVDVAVLLKTPFD
jgi:predicted nucleotidyltransferase